MHSKPPVDPRRSAGGELHADPPAWSPAALEAKEIFRQLIADEVRSGRLTPSRRRRIVRYAATLGMSAVEVGQLLEACRKQAAESDDPGGRCGGDRLENPSRMALRLSETPPAHISAAVKIWAVIALAILLDLLFLRWLW